jgi:carbon monoxide dehydrogenase subunit G
MDIVQRFRVNSAADKVWAAMSDVRLVASCLPGAELTEIIDERHQRGRLKLRLGPMSVSFAGETALTLDPATRTGIVEGKGVDQQSSSRVQSTIEFNVIEAGPNASDVNLKADVKLSGALAQFGRSSIVQDVAARITEQFAATLQSKLDQQPAAGTASDAAGSPAASTAGPAPAVQELSIVGLLFGVLWRRIKRMFGFGR